ncbi:DinB family protein [Solitalea lacus]|uniref:DinB family protein n=1 Tax=Solitalea lacus TaxID=2911172 RepID=UPI001EDAB9A9|nr:DinB family protein [Solitalea lacus]UKJ07820.1 DinB family protein [Solitalea lacus]
MTVFEEQYQLIKSSREVVFGFCESMTLEHFNQPVPNFGRGSIKATLLHVSNAYVSWLSRFALQTHEYFLQNDEVESLSDIKKEFHRADEAVKTILSIYKIPGQRIIGMRNDVQMNFSLMEIFTHVITHEFHHKGQIMSMGRILGYVPPDADIIRF